MRLQELGNVQTLNENRLETLSITKEPQKVIETVRVIRAIHPNHSDSDFNLVFNKENRSDNKGSCNRSSLSKSFDPLYVPNLEVLTNYT